MPEKLRKDRQAEVMVALGFIIVFSLVLCFFHEMDQDHIDTEGSECCEWDRELSVIQRLPHSAVTKITKRQMKICAFRA